MFELPEAYKPYYEHIRLATPELEDYKKYVESARKGEPATMEQFIDVAAFIASVMIPDKLGLTEKEKQLLAAHHLHNRMLKIFDVISSNAKK